jgi:hypothetical protein
MKGVVLVSAHNKGTSHRFCSISFCVHLFCSGLKRTVSIAVVMVWNKGMLRESSTRFYDQVRRHGPGTFNQSNDHRGTWGNALGYTERGQRSDNTVYFATSAAGVNEISCPPLAKTWWNIISPHSLETVRPSLNAEILTKSKKAL